MDVLFVQRTTDIRHPRLDMDGVQGGKRLSYTCTFTISFWDCQAFVIVSALSNDGATSSTLLFSFYLRRSFDFAQDDTFAKGIA